MQLRSYQQEAIDSIAAYFRTNAGNPIVAMPTGTGKSLVIAGFVQQTLQKWPRQRFIMLTHVQELIEQNANKLLELWPNAPLGVYSAGLKQKDTALPIIFGGVKSVINNIDAFGHRDLLIIDEGHLVSPKANTTYQQVIKYLKQVNPWLKVIMLTATPFRLGQGMLTDGEDSIATDFCYDITGVEAFNRLIAEGYLAPLVPFKADIGLDLSSVGVSNGEYKQDALQEAMDKTEITQRALERCADMARDRRSWLIFASGVQHAEHIAAALGGFGVAAAAVHGELSAGDRRARIEAFKRGQLRCLVNMNVLTTGFDHPPVDFIGMLRPTLSPGLWVQMLGRGTRPAPGKTNCLVADFSGNTMRLGPINDPRIPRARRKGVSGEPPAKECDACGCINHISAVRCVNCGAEFSFKTKLVETESKQELIANDVPQVSYYNVYRVFYARHVSRSKGEEMLRVNYLCDNNLTFTEYVKFSGNNSFRAKSWWQQRSRDDVPTSLEGALHLMGGLRVPARIRVWTNKQYPEILSAEFSTQATAPEVSTFFMDWGKV